MKFRLQHVHYMPDVLQSGILYVSEEYGIAGHLCACGCGSKVMTPLGPAEWGVVDENGEPTVYPSIGNWQQPCQSHYLITRGRVIWADKWTAAQIEAGRRAEGERRKAYYKSRHRQRSGILGIFWSWLSRLFSSDQRGG